MAEDARQVCGASVVVRTANCCHVPHIRNSPIRLAGWLTSVPRAKRWRSGKGSQGLPDRDIASTQPIGRFPLAYVFPVKVPVA